MSLLSKLNRVRTSFQRGALWQNANFMQLWLGQSISQFTSTLSREMIPYIAIFLLSATPFQMGLLGAASTLPTLLFGLLVGVWIDRLARRPVLIWANLLRAAALLLIPLAYLFGFLCIELLLLCALLVGSLSLLFDAAYQAFLPSLVEREALLEGNSKLGLSDSLAESVSPPTAGLLIQVLNPALAVFFNVGSYLCSAWAIGKIPAQCEAHQTEQHGSLWSDLRLGLAFMLRHPIIRWFALTTVVDNFFGWFFGAVYILYALHILGLSPFAVGLIIATGGIGGLAAALTVRAITARLGIGPTIVTMLLLSAAINWLIWLAGDLLALAWLLLVVNQIGGDFFRTLYQINEISLRQMLVPEQFLGRVVAAMQTLSQGVGTLGMLCGGLVAELFGLRSAVAIAAAGVCLAALLMACSPVHRIRTSSDL